MRGEGARHGPAANFAPARNGPYSRVVRLVIRWGWRVLLAAGIAAAVGYLPLRVFGGGGLERARMLDRQLRDVRRRVVELRDENDRMRREAGDLRDDPRAVERVARDELGMVRPADLVFQFE